MNIQMLVGGNFMTVMEKDVEICQEIMRILEEDQGIELRTTLVVVKDRRCDNL